MLVQLCGDSLLLAPVSLQEQIHHEVIMSANYICLSRLFNG